MQAEVRILISACGLARQDLQAGRGLALIDPHGDLAEAVLPFVPKERAKNLVYLNPTDDYPISLNPLDRVGGLETHLVADNLLAIFHKIWADSWGPRLSYVLQHSLVALIENHRTLLALPKLLTDEKFRQIIVKNIKDPFTRYFWEVEFARLTDRQRTEVISPIQNKVGAYLANRHLRNILGQGKSRIKFENIMNQGHIFIANLAKGRLGEEATNLLGSFLVTGFLQAALSGVVIAGGQKTTLASFSSLITNYMLDKDL